MRIIVIGESCKDIFVYGNVKRLSPEAPVPVFNPIESISNLGMSGNVVQNLKSLDSDLNIIHWSQTENITKTRYVDRKSNHMFLRVDDGEDIIKPLELNVSKLNAIRNVDAVIVSDYNKGFLTDEMLFEITKNSKFSIIDTKKQIGDILVEGFDFVKLNESEFNKHNFNESLLNKILVTLGSNGAKYEGKIYPSPDPKETIDVSGAGDTFTASFTLKYLKTNNVEESIIFANKMASIVVSKRGVATP
jgi:D-glycero-beta-D-manno-heptose-7-phosphate kinase